MKKTILVGMIAVMMLFAFTACEPQSLNYPIAGDNDIASVSLSNVTAFYAGSTDTEGTAEVTIHRVGGGTTTGVLGIVELDGTSVQPGINKGTVSFGAVKGTSFEYTYPITVEAVSVESLDVEYDEADLENEISAATALAVTVKGVYADGTMTDAIAFVKDGVLSRKFNDERTAIVYTLAKGTYSDVDVTASVNVKTPALDEPTVATVWTVQVADKDGKYTPYAATSNEPSINYNQTKSELLAKIRIVATTTTTPEQGEATTTTKVLSEGTDYVIQGIASGALIADGTFTVVPLVDTVAQGITFSTTTINYNVVDAIDWNGMTVVWAANPTNCKVGGTLSTTVTSNPDITVTLKKLSGEAVTTGYTISYIGVYSYPATDYKAGDPVTPTVKITYGSGATAESATRTLSQRSLAPATT